MVNGKKGVILPGIFGNALEWYDFTTYAFFVPIISQLFFPAKSKFISLLLTFGIFAMSFLIRPIGGLLFGYIGDKFGRKRALILSIITMSIPTFLFGALPTYAAIGLAAPLLLTLLRLIQGMAVSGELVTAISFLVEHAPDNRRGLMGSLAMFSAIFGIIMSSAVSTLIMQAVSQQQLLLWGWRIPFLVGGLLGIIGLILRLKTTETEHYRKVQPQSNTIFLIKDLFQYHSRILLKTIAITSIMAVGNYFVIGYFVTFLTQSEGLPLNEVMITNLITLTFFTSLIPLFGFFSDLVGRKMVLFIGMLGMIILAWPIFWLLVQHNIYYALLGQLLFVLFLAAVNAVIPVTLAEQFPTHIRNSGLAVGYNLSLASFGGTAPLVALTLAQETANKMAPAVYLIAVGVVAILTLTKVQESYKNTL